MSKAMPDFKVNDKVYHAYNGLVTIKHIAYDGLITGQSSEGENLYSQDSLFFEPIPEKAIKRSFWVPKEEEEYYFIDSAGFVDKYENNTKLDRKIIAFGNYFKTEEEAERASVLVKQLLFSLKNMDY